MKIAPGSPLNVSLQWDSDEIQPVGRLAYRDQIAYLEFDQAFLKTGLELSPVHHKTIAGLQRPYDTDVFAGLHGIFNDSLPDGWGRPRPPAIPVRAPRPGDAPVPLRCGPGGPALLPR